jgi:leader peptidase (prepilin peptidase)/N-methyltransferase
MWAAFFFIGTMFGSAANALIDRLPIGKSWVSGRSMCDKCKHVLEWNDLFPVWSYVFLGGKCRYCHSPIPMRNLWVEILVGLGFSFLFYRFGIGYNTMLLMLVFWITTIIAVMDLETRLVSEVMVAVWAALILVLQVQVISWGNLLGLGIGLLVIGGVWFFSRGRAMGFGDVEISAVMGFWLSWQKISVALWLAFVLGAIAGLVQVVNKKANMKSQMAFGPYLILGTWLSFLFGEKILGVWGL